MKFSNVRLLVKDFAKCFKFYSEQLGLEPAWGDENSGYAYFKVADGIEGFALFVSDWMAPSVGNADKELPVGYREKSLVAFSVDNVDDTYRALKEKGVIFVNEPTDILQAILYLRCLQTEPSNRIQKEQILLFRLLP
jgi:catechol 2,3-dioxygenase-like lactoylglutathione lyase family enzyme